MCVVIVDLPPVDSARVLPQTRHVTLVLALPKITCSFSQSLHLTRKNLLFGFAIYTHSANSNFFALKQGLWCDLLHSEQRYLRYILFVGLSPPGTLENFPLFPIPIWRFFCLSICVSEEAFPFFTLSATCSVCFLQKGQCVLNLFGIFIIYTFIDLNHSFLMMCATLRFTRPCALRVGKTTTSSALSA